MRQKLYDVYYRSLDLEPGAPLEDIDRMWHLLVQVWHPDRLPRDTAVYQHAVRRMQDINVARDELRSYWKTHGQAPPVGSTASPVNPRPQAQPAAANPRPAAKPEPPPGASQAPPPGASQAPPPGASQTPPPGSPPPAPGTTPPPPVSDGAEYAPRPFEKTWIHHFFDWMDQNAGESNPGLAIVFGFVLLVASFGLARILLLICWPMDHEFTNQDSMAVLVIAFVIGGFLFRLVYASYEVYKLLEKPFYEAVPVPPQTAYQRILQSLHQTRYDGNSWNISADEQKAPGTADGARPIVATMQIGEAKVTLHATIWPSNQEGWSLIALEFDADHPWRLPAPYAPVRATNEAIIQTLNAPAA